MTARATFTLEDESYAFLIEKAGNNRSAYINRLLKREKKRALERAIEEANDEEAYDCAYRDELLDWDSTLYDGFSR
jgi:predicted CopG family antitoxin